MELFLVLVCLRLNLLEKHLGHRFNCSTSTLSRICTESLLFLSSQLYPLITWPLHELLDHHIPAQFKDRYPATRVIMHWTVYRDCLSYKHYNTFKGLIGISLTGACIFVYNLHTGRISNQEITRCSGILDLVEGGDSVMADKGFDILYDLLIRGCKLNMPPFVKGGHMSKVMLLRHGK